MKCEAIEARYSAIEFCTHELWLMVPLVPRLPASIRPMTKNKVAAANKARLMYFMVLPFEMFGSR